MVVRLIKDANKQKQKSVSDFISRASVAPAAPVNTNFDDYLAPSAAPLAPQEYNYDPTPAARVSNSTVAPGKNRKKIA
jgi:hypothetical protein